MIIAGIDPGINGAIAYYWPATDSVVVEDFPVVDGEINLTQLFDDITTMLPITCAVIEKVGPRPHDGCVPAFRFGNAVGGVRGVLATLKVPIHLVTPAKWKKSFGLDADKEKSRALALRLWPGSAERLKRKMDHGRAEAALIALWGAQNVCGIERGRTAFLV